MQTMTFTGRLAADPQISEDAGKAVFRLIEKRGVDAAGTDRLVGVNCVCWMKGLNERVIGPGLAKGCEVLVVGAFIDTRYTARDGTERTAKELVIQRLTVLDWAGTSMTDTRDERPDRDADGSGIAADEPAEKPRARRRRAAA